MPGTCNFAIYPFVVFLLILWSARHCWWCQTAFLSGGYLYEQYFRVDGQKLDFSPHTLHPFLASRLVFGWGCFFFCGTEDYQSESASERNNGWVIFRASCFSSKHCRHKQWSSQWLQSCSGSNKSVLYFLFCAGWWGARGWRRLLMEEHILWSFILFLKKNYLLKKRVHCLWTVFFLFRYRGMFINNHALSV